MSHNLTIEAPAKVNLALDVVGKRIDGYHDMKMINHSISLVDVIELIPNEPYTIITQESIPVNQNLITKALTYLSRIYNKSIDFSIRLDKRIPERAGLGGGSSDAAAAILLALRYWGIEESDNRLISLALKLGSDVPYSLFNRPAVVEGLGEKLEFIEMPEFKKILVINPKIKINSKEAFDYLDSQENLYHPNIDETLDLLENNEIEKLKEKAGNSFTIPAVKKYPIIQEIIDDLYDLGAEYATMSGSGSTIIGYFNNEESAQIAAEKYKNYDTFLADLI